MRKFLEFRWALFVLACLVLNSQLTFGAKAGATDDAVPVLTIDQAVSLAVAHNRTVQIATLDVAKFKEKLAQTKTKRLPKFSTYFFFSQLLAPISFNYQTGAFGTYPGIGPVPATNTNITTPSRPTFYAFLQAAQPLTQLYKCRRPKYIHRRTSARQRPRLRLASREDLSHPNLRREL